MEDGRYYSYLLTLYCLVYSVFDLMVASERASERDPHLLNWQQAGGVSCLNGALSAPKETDCVLCGLYANHEQ